MNEADQNSFKKMILGGFKDDEREKKSVAVTFRDVADRGRQDKKATS